MMTWRGLVGFVILMCAKHHMILASSCSILQALETLPPDVAEDYLQNSNAEIRTDLCGKYIHIPRLLLFSEGM